MLLSFTAIADLKADSPLVQVGNEPDGDLIEYFLEEDRVRNNSYKVLLGDYSSISFVQFTNRVPAKNYTRFGIKTFPKIGAYGWFRSKYENVTHMLVPLRAESVKYEPPTFTFTQSTNTIQITITPPSSVTYECYRIIFRHEYFATEIITYDTQATVDKPASNTYELYVIGYRSTGEVSEETPRQSITVVNPVPEQADGVTSLAITEAPHMTGGITLNAGNNVSLSQNSTSKIITIAASGGGSSDPYYENPIDAPPSTPSSYDDEFDDTTLDAKWAWLNQGVATWTESGGKGALDVPSTGSTANIRAIVQAVPSGDYTITCKCVTLMPLVDLFTAGIILHGSTSGSGRSHIAQFQRRTAAPSGAHFYLTNYSSVTAYAANLYSGAWDTNVKYIRVQMIGSTATISISVDGTFWVTLLSFLVTTYLTSGVTHIGLASYRSNATAELPSIALFDWFRVTQP